MPTHNIAQAYAQILADQHVKHVYLMAGGMVLQLLDAIHALDRTRIVCVHHEQAAAFAAEAEGRLSNVPGVAIATSGPGATNLVTGIASCYFDSVPAIFITGQVNRDECIQSSAIRQTGFQETNIVDLVRPITKHSVQVTDANQAVQSLIDAFQIARSGRPGPVLIDLPTNIQLLDQEGAEVPFSPEAPATGNLAPDDPLLARLFSLLGDAKRPLALIGGGVRTARCADQMQGLLEDLRLPAVCSLMGLDALPGDHPLRGGFIGVYGNRWANWALAKADVLLVLGSRLDIRQTGADIPRFLKGKTLFRVDCDEGELEGRVNAHNCCKADLADFLDAARGYISNRRTPPLRTDQWLASIRDTQSLCDDVEEIQTEAINPNKFMHSLSAASGDAAAFVCDVGNNQMWAAQSLRPLAGQRILNSGGMGAMGFALPAAMGAAFATGRPVVAIAGDGGLLVNIQDLQTIARNRLPVKIVVLNNHVLGLVRGYQDTFFGGRVVATDWGYDAPDFVAVAEAFGIPGARIDAGDAVATGLADLWQDPSGPFLLEVRLPSDMIVAPSMMFGNPHDEMHPPRNLGVSH